MAKLEFTGAKHMLAWIRRHPLGAWIRGKIINDAYGSVMNSREPVVVELCSDGAVFVFGSKRLSVKVVQRPHSTDIRAGVRIDEYVALSLPRLHRHYYAPGRVRGVGFVERVTPSDLIRRENGLAFIEAMELRGGEDGKRKSKPR